MTDEERYNNRQIERMFDEQSRDIKSHMDAAIAPLTTQVMKTNGTVTFLTKMVYMALGALLLLVPWAGWVTNGLLDDRKNAITQEDIERSVDNAFEANLELNP